MTEPLAIAALILTAIAALVWRALATPACPDDEHDFPFGVGGGADHVWHGKANDR